ncbi:TPA: YSIRK-type signal peptide-containing protein [Streptococcus pneumoniae]|nr:YSIRK-type signal peptide-containing protein [Streptococcus pneumoniae]
MKYFVPNEVFSIRKLKVGTCSVLLGEAKVFYRMKLLLVLHRWLQKSLLMQLLMI